MYQILFTRQATRTLRRIPRQTALQIRARLDQLAIDPYASLPNVTKLQNRPGYRLRVGDWRVLYEIQKKTANHFGFKDWFSRSDLSMSVQIIAKDGRPEWAVIPYEEYVRLVEEAEMMQDIRDYDTIKDQLAKDEELVPSAVTYALLEGAHPIRVWRTYRGLTQHQLAEQSGISKAYLSQIELGKRTGTAEVLRAIAKALGVTVDDLLDA